MQRYPIRKPVALMMNFCNFNTRNAYKPTDFHENKTTGREAPDTLGASAALNPKGVEFGRPGWEFSLRVFARRHTPWGGRAFSIVKP